MLSIVALFAVACVYTLHRYVLYPRFFLPQGRIPAAHWSARYCRIWIIWKRYLGRQNAALLSAHREHGSVVLLAPGELSVSCIDNGVRNIYDGGYEKSDFYPSLFNNYSALNTFTTIHHGPHGERRRMMSKVFSKTSVLSSQIFSDAVGTTVLQQLLPKLRDKCSEATEAGLLFKATTLDITSAFLLGAHSGTRFVNNEKQAKAWIDLYELRNRHHFLPSELPIVLKAAGAFGMTLVPQSVGEATDYLEASCSLMCDSAEHRILSSSLRSTATGDIDVETVYSRLRSCLIKSRRECGSSDVQLDQDTRHSLASEMLDLLSAGHETSSIALSFMFHNLALRPDLQARLRDEQKSHGLAVTSTSEDENSWELPTAKQLDGLPLLHAVFLETLRLYAPIAGAQYRITPDLPGGVSLGKHNMIPGGLRVSSSAICLHRNEEVFPDSETWVPERWLPDHGLDEAADAKRLKEQHRWFWAFSSGGRGCIGQHLASAQIKAIATALLASFKISHLEAPGKTGPYLQEDRYTAHPVEPDLNLRFISI